MIVTHQLQDLQSRPKDIVLAAGFFDGVHLGHQRVIHDAVQAATARKGEAWVMTFAPHPMKVLNPAKAPLMLTATEHKLALLHAYGMDGCIVLPFTRDMAATEPKTFADWLFHCAPSLRHVVVGENWRFGAKAAGTPEVLAQFGQAAGVSVSTVPPVLQGPDPVSSTRIRTAIQQGCLQAAEDMLGRPPSVLGTVTRGRAIGRTLGFPSANLDPHNEVLPPIGIYAVEARVGNSFYAGALSFGTRPTFDAIGPTPDPLLELHLIDFHGSLYDTRIEAFFLQKLREEECYDSPQTLRQQIARDVDAARHIVKNHGLPPPLKQHVLANDFHLQPENALP